MTRMMLVVMVVLISSVAITWSVSSAAVSQRSLRCLHDLSEQPQQRERRMQATDLAEAIYRAERRAVPRPRPRADTYRPLDQLGNLPPTPAGFRLQFHTDGMSYLVSLKDTLDGCQYAIFSDQDGYIYEGSPRRDVRTIPVDTQ